MYNIIRDILAWIGGVSVIGSVCLVLLLAGGASRVDRKKAENERLIDGAIIQAQALTMRAKHRLN